jgi:hypothetical protein
MDLIGRCNEKVTVERSDGARYENVNALVTRNMILIPDSNVPIAINDTILRQLPSGLVEKMLVTDPGFYSAINGIPGHYQVKYSLAGQKSAGTPGYQIHLSGDNARVNVSSTDNSVNTVVHQAFDLKALAIELPILRDALAQRANTAEEYAAIGAIATAEIEAKAGDESKVSKAFSKLGSAGKWVFDTAREIGVQVAAEVIKGRLGS